MAQTILATFEDRVLKPAQPLDLPEHAHVRLIVESLHPDEKTAEKLAKVQAFWNKTRPHSKRMTRDQLHERR